MELKPGKLLKVSYTNSKYSLICLRHILNIRWPEKISNKELWQKINNPPVEEELKRRKWEVDRAHTTSLGKPYSGTLKESMEEEDQKIPGGETLFLRWR
jgi:hypothetical protein